MCVFNKAKNIDLIWANHFGRDELGQINFCEILLFLKTILNFQNRIPNAIQVIIGQECELDTQLKIVTVFATK